MHGTRYDLVSARLACVTDRTGACHAQLAWNEAADRLVRLTVDGAVVDGAICHHPLLGAAHTVGDTAMTALDWARPAEIPAIAAPGRLPLGAGAAILNTIALLARDAGVTALRYAGPYPTAALWRSLARSFRCDADEAAFTAGALDRAVRVARDPIPIDFAPAPHERIAIPRGFVELRDRLERAVIDGVGYEPGGSPARLVAAGPAAGHRAEVWFGDACHARVATLAADGRVVDGPHPIPACASPVIGRAFPAALRDALAELVADAVPAPLATDARALCAAAGVAWADLGARAATERPGGFAVHAALWDRIAPLGLARLALALAEALAPVVAAAVVRRASLPAPLRQC
ncbi:MAG TPA: hypothetical protein VHT91_06115 [Kofleriaceae bacterium]|nr:hypothetical protein [Kofleriaceae bacterium]